MITLLKHDDAHGRIGKWHVKLSEYDLQYVHVPGSQNVIADGLSRLPACYYDQWDDDPAKLNNREGEGTEVVASLGGGQTELGMVAAISVEEKERWGRWLESGWYGLAVRFLLEGTLEGEDLTVRGRRLVRKQAARYRIYDGQSKGLFFVERGGKMAEYITEEEVMGILERCHDNHGHFGGKLFLTRLIGRFY